jgi:hypothetical protein
MKRLDLSGMGRPGPRRLPAYVHAPEETRELVRVLGKFDYKSRQTLFRQAHALLNVGTGRGDNFKPASRRIEKCLSYAANRSKTRSVLKEALRVLRGKINLSLLHPNDLDRALDVFLVLRNYTFCVETIEVRRALRELGYPEPIASQIEGLAHKVFSGSTPRSNSRGRHWSEDAIDLWIKMADSAPIE